jgi:hypothetical protein
VFDQALFDDEEVEVLSIDGGKRIAAALAASTLASYPVGWRMFQWLQRSLVPDRSVVD